MIFFKTALVCREETDLDAKTSLNSSLLSLLVEISGEGKLSVLVFLISETALENVKLAV